MILFAIMAKKVNARRWTQLIMLRKRRKLSQEKFGARVGLTQGMISHLENGESDYTRTHVETFARELGVDPADLVATDSTNPNSIYGLINSLPEDERPRALELLKVFQQTAKR
jgi:transcriptional regulator with XRE-family HTH domain